MPFSNHYRRTVADRRANLHLIHQALRPWQAHSKTSAGGMSFAHSFRNIGNAGTMIFKAQLDATRISSAEGAPLHNSLPGVLVDVSAELGSRGDDAGDFGRAEAEFRGDIPDGATGHGNVRLLFNLDLTFVLNHHLRTFAPL